MIKAFQTNSKLKVSWMLSKTTSTVMFVKYTSKNVAWRKTLNDNPSIKSKSIEEYKLIPLASQWCRNARPTLSHQYRKASCRHKQTRSSAPLFHNSLPFRSKFMKRRTTNNNSSSKSPLYQPRQVIIRHKKKETLII